MKNSSFVVVNTPGQCRWCKCTMDHACANGCSWANAQYTLCSECVPLDTALKTSAGRRELAEFLQEHGFLVGSTMPVAIGRHVKRALAAARPSRLRRRPA